MPRNVNGTYTLPLPPVIENTLIEATWANTTDDDIAQALTDSLDRYGRGGMAGPFRIVDGTVGAPGLAFTAETGTGLYRPSNGIMAAAVQGAKVQQWSAAGVTVEGAGIFRSNVENGDPLISTFNLNVGSTQFFVGNVAGDVVLGNRRTDSGALRFYTADVERMRIALSGEVGVGLTVPADPLTVAAHLTTGLGIGVRTQDNAVPAYISFRSSTNVVTGFHNFNVNTGEFVHAAGYAGYGGFHTFYTDGSERMRVDALGRVFMDPYTTPTIPARLNVLEDGANFSSINVRSIRATADPPRFFDTSLIRGWSAFTASTKPSVDIRFHHNAYHEVSGDLSFWTTDNVNVFAEKMRLSHDGRLGIGTANPGAKLHVLSSAAGEAQYLETTTGYVGLGLAAPGQLWAMRASASEMSLADLTGGSQTVTIRKNQNVGLGTAAAVPNTALEIRRDGDSISDSANAPAILIHNRWTPGNAANYRVGSVDFAAYRDVMDPSRVASVWCENRDYPGNIGVLKLGARTNGSSAPLTAQNWGIAVEAQQDATTWPGGRVYVNERAVAYEVGFRDIPVVTSIPDWPTTRGKLASVAGGGVSLPSDGTLQAGATITFYADGTAITISMPGGTLKLAGTTSTGQRTLAANGVATVVYLTPNIAVISGAGLT